MSIRVSKTVRKIATSAKRSETNVKTVTRCLLRYRFNDVTLLTSLLRQRICRGNDMFGVDPKFFHRFSTRRAQSKAIQADNFAIYSDVSVPEMRNAGFDRDTFAA